MRHRITMHSEDPYQREIEAALPRLLALFDTNPISPTFGMGDRYRWAWKLIDFGNGTFQGAAHGLASLLTSGRLPEFVKPAAALRRIDGMFAAAERLRYPDGSLEEAFPHESSFCVTALVAYDLLSAVELLGERLPDDVKRRYLGVVRPMIEFLHRSEEGHAFISNHLATAAAALLKWTALTREPGERRGGRLLRRILEQQSSEGWFREYEGADAGYQTLCTWHLADLHRLRPDLGLGKPLARSIRFLWHCAHPDGSFGGLYGSRNTRFYYPAGIELLAEEIPEAAALAAFMRRSICSRRTVTLASIDEPNLVPMFNSYCRASAWLEWGHEGRGPSPETTEPRTVPAAAPRTWRKHFPEAGLLIDKGLKHYTIISHHKGGVCYHFRTDKRGNTGRIIDVGAVVGAEADRPCTSQSYRRENRVQIEPHRVVIEAPLVPARTRLPTPLQFAALRLMNVSLMRFRAISQLVKRLLVRMLITGKARPAGWNRRTITLGPDLRIEDDARTDDGRRLPVEKPGGTGEWSSIHMASAGYWQRQDDAA